MILRKVITIVATNLIYFKVAPDLISAKIPPRLQRDTKLSLSWYWLYCFIILSMYYTNVLCLK